MTRFLLLSDSCRLVDMGRSIWREDGSVVYICCWPRQRSHFWVLVPWDSLPYFTLSDSRLPFSSPPTTRRATVEVVDPASTRDLIWYAFPVVWLWVGPTENISLHLVSKETSVCHSAMGCFQKSISTETSFISVSTGPSPRNGLVSKNPSPRNRVRLPVP
jgi:hypothetical protein